ncbi:MAG: hypothetical protein H8D74_01045 [Chloroflexi bacterium]|nr:hypothetical protein [Chloroflexota bacterium]
MIRNLEIPPGILSGAKEWAAQKGWTGQNAWVAHTRTITNLLHGAYGRWGLCLKVFAPLNEMERENPAAFRWSGVPLTEATRVQNLFAMRDLAPRVYGIVLLNDRQLAQVTDFGNGRGTPDKKRAARVAEKFHISAFDLQSSERDIAHYLGRYPKWVGKWLVDFGRLYFAQPKEYEDRLRHHVAIYHKKKHRQKIGYQPCPELGIGGRRDIDRRRKWMRLDEFDFVDKTVLDIGCNQGAFTRLAEKLGAKRCVGVDHKFARGNAELANWLGYWNTDFLELSLPRDAAKITAQTGIEAFDIVFCLSTLGHAGGYAPWFPKLVAPGGVTLFEGQGRDKRETYQKALEGDFSKVEWLGWVKDHGVHPLWRCWK